MTPKGKIRALVRREVRRAVEIARQEERRKHPMMIGIIPGGAEEVVRYIETDEGLFKMTAPRFDFEIELPNEPPSIEQAADGFDIYDEDTADGDS